MVIHFVLVLGFLVQQHLSFGFRNPSSISPKSKSYRLFLEKWVSDGDGVFSDSGDVEEILNRLRQTLTKSKSPNSDNSEVVDENSLKLGFDDILSKIRNDDNFSDQTKTRLILEISMQQNESVSDSVSKSVLEFPSIDSPIPNTSLYSMNDAPYCIVYGPGRVGQSLLKVLKDFGKAVQIKPLDSTQLTVIQDSELKFILKDVKTIIIAADKSIPEKKGWFGGDDIPDAINEKGLKRLLTIAMRAREVRGVNDLKVVCLGTAMKPSRGIASFLAGDTTDLDDEFVLQCQQRSLPFLLVKIGELIGEEASIPTPKTSLRDGSPGPILINVGSKSSSSGFTRVSHATEALLRGVGEYATSNTTISVFTTGSESQAAPGLDSEWEDQFLKITGPELLRLPLRYASVGQTARRLGRVAQNFQDRQTSPQLSVLSDTDSPSLITPIEVTRFANGVRILFRPKEVGYSSSREEKVREQRELDERTAAEKLKRKSGYVSPEAELALLRASQAVTDMDDSALSARKEPDPSSFKEKKKPRKREGGLEVIVDAAPVRRVRIRRCEMGPDTVVKEESEAVLLRALTKAVEGLENDYKNMLDQVNKGNVK